jgi:hypothetical protein
MNTVMFALLIGVALITGYAVALAQLSFRPLSYIARRGFLRAMGTRDLPEWLEDVAYSEKRLFALHVLLAIDELGGPRGPIPLSSEAWKGVCKLAEHRMELERRAGKEPP